MKHTSAFIADVKHANAVADKMNVQVYDVMQVKADECIAIGTSNHS